MDFDSNFLFATDKPEIDIPFFPSTETPTGSMSLTPLKFPDSSTPSTASNNKKELLGKIEKIMEDIVKSVTEDKPPVLLLRNQKDWSNCNYEDDIVSLKPSLEAQLVEVKFSSARSRPKMAIILHLLAKIYRLIITDSSCTKRELYYQNVAIVKHQSVIDCALRDICVLLETPLCDLGVTSTSKGLIAGDIHITTADNQTIDCMTANGVLLPHDINGIKNIATNAKFVLVVEKDATFQKLLNENVISRLGPCILITGKGFPDVNTRLMLKRIWDDFRIPILGLFDADPHGIEIMCTYRFGSLSMSHQSDELAVPSMRWLGVLPSDITRLNISTIPTASEDKMKLTDLLERPYMKNNPKIIKEINILIKIQKKAEIEGVGALSNCYLSDNYLPIKINNQDFI